MNTKFDQESHDENGIQSTIFLNDVVKVDCAVFDPSKGVLGQSWRADVTLSGFIGKNGFVYDFSKIKALVREVLKSSIDHALVMPINSQSVQFRGMDTFGKDKCEWWSMKSKVKAENDFEWEYRSPTGAVFPTRSVAVTRQALEQEVIRSLKHRLPQEISNIHVTLREEEVDATEAVFRYTHGISGHDGMCQRLLHGHRSRIQVIVGEERRPDLEHYIARDVLGSNVHIATPKQFKSGVIPPGTRGKTKTPVVLAYDAALGHFEAVLPADRVFSVEHETSIECIALEIAKLIKREEMTAERVKVILCEGIDKGAIAEI